MVFINLQNVTASPNASVHEVSKSQWLTVENISQLFSSTEERFFSNEGLFDVTDALFLVNVEVVDTFPWNIYPTELVVTGAPWKKNWTAGFSTSSFIERVNEYRLDWQELRRMDDVMEYEHDFMRRVYTSPRFVGKSICHYRLIRSDDPYLMPEEHEIMIDKEEAEQGTMDDSEREFVSGEDDEDEEDDADEDEEDDAEESDEDNGEDFDANEEYYET